MPRRAVVARPVDAPSSFRIGAVDDFAVPELLAEAGNFFATAEPIRESSVGSGVTFAVVVSCFVLHLFGARPLRYPSSSARALGQRFACDAAPCAARALASAFLWCREELPKAQQTSIYRTDERKRSLLVAL